MKFLKKLLFITLVSVFGTALSAQVTISGSVTDDVSGEELIGASVIVEGTGSGTVTDFDGSYELKIKETLPVNIVISYVGYEDKVIPITEGGKVDVNLSTGAITTVTAVVKTQRISDKQKAGPLTVESLDLLAIKETTSDNFYDGLGSLKGVDMTSASLGFKVINTRGFNSTSPVRSLQIIDGVDNQSPGLNFSLGNFLGSSELDILKVDLVVGASSAFYGPNAFNGVIAMETKSPFYHKGLSASLKVGERNMAETAIRWGDAINNKEGLPVFGYKINFSYLRADDWVADNKDAVYDTDTGVDNPGGYDAVNTYGDEYSSNTDLSGAQPWSFPGIRQWHRTGYEEKDLVDYDTRNIKAATALHFRLDPSKESESAEFIAAGNYSMGTTVYQGDNRFSLKDIAFWQTRLELRKKNKYFLRAYYTDETSGNSYDPYLTALLMQREAKTTTDWAKDYVNYWRDNFEQVIEGDVENGGLGYPRIEIIGGEVQPFDFEGVEEWYLDPNNIAALNAFNEEAAAVANQGGTGTSQDFFVPGTARYDSLFTAITTSNNSNDALVETRGSRIYDRSALYHVQGEYNFTPDFLEYIRVGGNYRLYAPETQGSIFIDTTGNVIRNSEFGLYTGFEKKFAEEKLALSATLRVDKNQNFNLVASPAASLVYKPKPGNYLRVSFSSAVRNPTLSDQYLNLNVGRATLKGNLDGVEDLVDVDSFEDYIDNDFDRTQLDSFSIAAVQPEKVKTAEIGYRTTLWNSVYLDAGYYFSIYDQFLGYQIGLDVDLDEQTGIPQGVQALRYAANSENQVTTQGFSIGLSYYLWNYFQVSGNYSWNKLNVEFEDDPIIPAFNTPEHKYNLSFSGRNIQTSTIKNFGFNVSYKWVQGFLFEGSPQFTGLIPSYGLLSAQINKNFPKQNITLKLGASNLLNNRHYEAYGGPLIGRLAYISAVYEFKKK